MKLRSSLVNYDSLFRYTVAPYLRATGAEVVGISTDSVESHQKFTEHHNLPLRLLADSDGKVNRAYNATSWLPGRAARAVVVVDAEGIIRYRKVEAVSLFRPRDAEIIEAIRAAQKMTKA